MGYPDQKSRLVFRPLKDQRLTDWIGKTNGRQQWPHGKGCQIDLRVKLSGTGPALIDAIINDTFNSSCNVKSCV